MREALDLAARARGRSSPNPPVGAVLVNDGKIVGRGWTQPPGGPHAEIVALDEAGAHSRGATLYVTLEPCSHHGRTPPCADAIIASGVTSVLIGAIDPNPIVSGSGVAKLREAGIAVEIGVDERAAREMTAGFRKWIRTGTPLVSAKFASSLDGRTATRTGHSQWITGEVARAHAHEVRNAVDAIVAGIGTILADDPSLTARPQGLTDFDGRQPLRVVVDSGLRISSDAKLFAQPGETLVVHALNPEMPAAQRLSERATLLDLPAGDGRVDLNGLLLELGRRGCLEVLIEGGATLLGAFFDLGLVDYVYAYHAPLVIGGISATPAVGGRGVESLQSAWRIATPRTVVLGSDMLVAGMLAERTWDV